MPKIIGKCWYCSRPVDFRHTNGAQLRTIASDLSGLPVSAFRLVTSSNVEIFDTVSLDTYPDIHLGCTVTMDTWDGWNDVITGALGGFTNQVDIF